MSHTNYEVNQNQLNVPKVQDNDTKSVKSYQSKQTNKSNYREYKLKDYKNMQTAANQKVGGLGANVGSETWELAKRKKEIAMQYANNLQKINSVNIGKSYKPSRFQSEKDKTARDRANDYANNIPKPRLSRKEKQSDKGSEIHRTETGEMENNAYELQRNNADYLDIDHAQIGFNQQIDSTG